MYVSPLIDPKAQQTGLDDRDDQHHRGQAHPRPAVGQPRALHHRARGAGRSRCRCCRCSRASCCSPTAPTGCGSAATRAATSSWPAAWPALPYTRRRATTTSTRLSGLPTHALTESGADPREVYVESLQKWFDVRARYLQWTDGRLAQMLIATDITARLRAEEQPAAQAEKAQMTSRLVTMGEMASSVAHELNQPLTAITNYCNGMVSRVRAETIVKRRPGRRAAEDGAPGRTRRADHPPHPRLREAQRAAAPAVPRRGRSSMTRWNWPASSCAAAMSPSTPMSRSGCRSCMVDPILIEQVVLNLLKNAAEAIDSAQLPTGAPPHRVACGAAAHARGRRRHRVQRHRHGPRHQGRGASARLYEAFFSTKAEGLGIGLSLCRSIVESHRGRMKAQNLYNGESSWVADLPSRCRSSCPPRPTMPIPTPPSPPLEAALAITNPTASPE